MKIGHIGRERPKVTTWKDVKEYENIIRSLEAGRDTT
jgi:hypothetical protein